MSGINILTLNIKVSADKTEVEQYGGIENYTMLIEDILNRYANPEYFNNDLVEELLNEGDELK